jgi:hypothetical protein
MMRPHYTSWWNETRTGRSLLFVFFVTIILFFAGACFALLYEFTQWPVWLQVVISLPAGFLFFMGWAKMNETNGFDGAVCDQQPKNRDDSDADGPAAV